MISYVLGEDAESDLDAIWEYIAADNVDAADRWIDKLFTAFQEIANTPGIGHKRSDLTQQDVLFSALDAYLIIYLVLPEMVQVVAVTQGSRNIPSFLRHRLS